MRHAVVAHLFQRVVFDFVLGLLPAEKFFEYMAIIEFLD
jgi:hypothetical protein